MCDKEKKEEMEKNEFRRPYFKTAISKHVMK